MDGGRIGEHVDAVAEDRDDRAIRTRQFGAERGAGAPPQARRRARSEIKIRRVERALLEEERVFVDDDALRMLGAVDAMAHPRRIERHLACAAVACRLPGTQPRLALLLDPAPP